MNVRKESFIFLDQNLTHYYIEYRKIDKYSFYHQCKFLNFELSDFPAASQSKNTAILFYCYQQNNNFIHVNELYKFVITNRVHTLTRIYVMKLSQTTLTREKKWNIC